MLGRLITTAPRRILAAASVILVLAGVLAAGVIDVLALNRYESPGSESMQARHHLAEQFGTGSSNIALLVTADDSVDDPEASAAGDRIARELAGQDGIDDVWSYWSAGAPETMRSEDGRHALVLAWAPGDADHVRGQVLPGIEDWLAGVDEPVRVQLGGGDEVFRVVADQARADFVRAEMIVIPLVGALLWLVYRRLAPALVTLGIGIFSVVGTLGILRLVAAATEVSTFAANIALVMGIGLGVDYGLFVTYRFREELARGRSVPDAVRATVAGAGRTVLFSGATVAASLAVLFVFPFAFLSSFAYAGIAVVGTAVAGATIVLPAALLLLGDRVVRHDTTADDGGNARWHRLTHLVMRRPVISGGLALAILLGLGAPALGANFGSPDDRLLPADQPVRQMYDTIRDDFSTEDADVVHVVAPDTGGIDVGDNNGDLHLYATELSDLDGVLRVDSAVGSYADGSRMDAAGPDDVQRFTGETGTWLSALPTGDRLMGDPGGLVAEIRALEAPFDVYVGGYPADLADYRDSVLDQLPLVAVLILGVTFVILFLMTGSVVAPVKASILNLLSLSVMFGVLVWGFQDGGLAGVLGFAPMGTIEPSIPILMFCVAYGLSMDYEVFLLARIKEDYDRTGDAYGSVPRGIARSAPLVTAAALILGVSFAVYATSGVVFLQQLGIGMALAILVDATVIRGVLMPAMMRLAGRANWWAPRPLRRLHDRIGLRETPTEWPVNEPGTAPGRASHAQIS